MISDKQLAANQQNAQLSTGPKTPETKAISAQNSRGPIANFLLSSENAEEFRTFTDEITASYNPQDAHQRSLVDEVVTVRWRIARYAAMETALLENALRKKREELGPDADHVTLVAAALEQLIENSKTFNTLRRYQREDKRAYYLADKQLAELRAPCETPEQNEPISEARAMRILMNEPIPFALPPVNFTPRSAAAQSVKPKEVGAPTQTPKVTTE